MLTRHCPRWAKISGFLIMALACLGCLGAARVLYTRPSAQIAYYNQGLTALKLGQVKQAIALFDRSLAAYQQQSVSVPASLVTPPPSSETAALAYFYEGLAYAMEGAAQKKAELFGQAMIELQSSIKLNPGAPFAPGVKAADASRLNQEALAAKLDLELLIQQHPQQAQSLQNGKPGPGKPQSGPPKPGQPGKGGPGQGQGSGQQDGV